MDARLAPPEVEIREMVDRALSRMNTAIPGKILSFNAANQTVQVVPAIKMKSFIDGVQSLIELPPVINVPLIFPFSVTGGFAITIPVTAGDPCLLIFSQRAIDNWHDRGGVQPPESGAGSRHHDLTDAFAILAPIPLPNVLANYITDGIEIRNTSKTSRVTVKASTIEVQCGTCQIVVNSNGSLTITAPGNVSITAPLTTVTGNLQVSGGISAGNGATITGSIAATGNVSDANGSMQEMRSTYNGHTHPENGDGGGTTSAPNQQMS